MDTERRDREKGQQEGECSHRGSRWPNPLAAKTSSCRQSLDAKKSNSEVICGRSSLSGRQRGGWDGRINHEGQKNDSDT